VREAVGVVRADAHEWMAMAQRFTRRTTRISMNALAGLILAVVLISLLRLPRI
jgi:hypothetical protein